MAKVLTLSIDGRNVEIENRFTILVSTATIGGSLDNTDYIYICSGTFTFTFPTAVGNRNRYSLINEGTGVITAVFTAGQNANNSTSVVLNPQVALDFISNNSNWRIF